MSTIRRTQLAPFAGVRSPQPPTSKDTTDTFTTFAESGWGSRWPGLHQLKPRWRRVSCTRAKT